GNRDRDRDRLGQRVRTVLEPEDTEPDGTFEAGRWLTAFRASNQIRPGGGGEAQPATWAAEVGHVITAFLPGRPRPHAEQRRFITGSSDRWSPSSKYTRWRPPPNTRRACPQSGQV